MPPGMRNTAIGGQNIEVVNASFIVPKGALSFACANCLLYHFSPNPQCIALTKAKCGQLRFGTLAWKKGVYVFVGHPEYHYPQWG